MTPLDPTLVLTLQDEPPLRELTRESLEAALARVGTGSIGFAVLERCDSHFIQTAVDDEGSSRSKRTPTSPAGAGARASLGALWTMDAAPKGAPRAALDVGSAMACDVAPFSTMPWAPGGHPLEQKKTLPSRNLTLLRFDVGFEDPAWCVHGHHIYVVSGRFALRLDDEVRELGAGDAVVLDPGTRHRALNPGDTPVELFVLSAAP